MMWRKFLIGSFILLVGIIFMFINNSYAGLEPGNKPPAFKLPSLEGKETTIQDFHGKVVILHMWKCK